MKTFTAKKLNNHDKDWNLLLAIRWRLADGGHKAQRKGRLDLRVPITADAIEKWTKEEAQEAITGSGMCLDLFDILPRLV